MIRRLYGWWLWVWATRVRNHFCFDCDRSTFVVHNHHAENDQELRRILGEEWRS